MGVEVQDIFIAHIQAYTEKHKLNHEQLKAVNAILNCRTASLGSHVDVCDNCGYLKISYNSCRNRHCPKCQSFSREVWIDKQRENLLNTHYFHVVFTVPAELNRLFLRHPVEMYNLLFRASSETILELCCDQKYLNATPGITAVLHTWGQNLLFHPHIHMIVTGGGLSRLGKWRTSKKDFFLPIHVLSAKFRGKFLALLKKEIQEIDGALLNVCYNQKWVVYCKPPFGNAEKVIAYLGRYTHRVAISNSRILSMDNDTVTFTWKDYAHQNQHKLMTLKAEEFIRRFLLHVLPHGFRKIRHYGLFAARGKGKRIALCRRLTNSSSIVRSLSPLERLRKILGDNFDLCPCCGVGHLSRASPYGN